MIINQRFTDDDRLRLLQLMTRRAMAERQSRAAEKEGEGLDADNFNREEPKAVDDTFHRRRTTLSI